MTDNSREAAFLRQAYIAATHSPDPSTQNGAVLVGGNLIISTDCNRTPTGVNLNSFRLTRPQKYDYIVHAEVSTVLRGFRSTQNGTNIQPFDELYVIWYACSDCARVIIESGIKRIVGHWQAHEFTMNHGQPKWRDSVQAGLEMLIESGVQCQWYDGPIDGPAVLMNGVKFDPSVTGLDTPQ